MSRLGVFGGTFDPIHSGHLRVAEEVRNYLHLEKILFLPSFRPPHKLEEEISEAQTRYEMVVLALEDHPQFEVSDMEIRKGGISFTVETLTVLRKSCPKTELFLIMGIDQLIEMETWKDPKTIFQLAHVVVMSRPGYKREKIVDRRPETLEWQSKMLWVEVSPIEISSTMIRERIRRSEPVQDLLPQKVEDYILQKGLYKSSSLQLQ
ncbi:nicotinate-nucleotide adenylyltransferase [candidate division TA06 bacterium]|nr:nicotinate-nucleotide adenylyltransferase [candidate division TA06 bacterium]